MTPKYFGYCRFSQAKQSNGSIDRQEDYIKAYAAQKNITITRIFKDEGVSAKAGANREDGTAWAEMVSLADSETHILLENLDRFSREDIYTAQFALNALIAQGITVHIIKSGRILKKDSEDALTNIIFSVVENSVAHEENKKKRDRATAAHQKRLNAISEGKFAKATTPYWIDLNGSNDGYILNKHASTVKRMFALCNSGNGSTLIAQILNSDGIKTFRSGKEWNQAGVLSVLKNRVCIGEFYGKEGYLPAAVDRRTFDLAQLMISDRKQMKVGRNTGNINVLKGLSFCYCCKEKMHLGQRNKKSGRWLRCSNKAKVGCVNGDIKEEIALKIFREIVIKVHREDSITIAEDESQKLIDAQNRLAELERDMVDSYSSQLAKMVSKAESDVKEIKAREDKRLLNSSWGNNTKQHRLDLLEKADDQSKSKLNALLRRIGLRIIWARIRDQKGTLITAETEELIVCYENDEIKVIGNGDEMIERIFEDRDYSSYSLLKEMIKGNSISTEERKQLLKFFNIVD